MLMDEKHYILYEEKEPQKMLGVLEGEDFATWVAQELTVSGLNNSYSTREISSDEARSILEKVLRS